MNSRLSRAWDWLSAPESLDLKIDEVQVWLAYLDVDKSTLQRLESVLSADERERAARFHFERDRLRFVICRGLLRSLLGRYLNTAPDRIQFRYGTEGKSALVGGQGNVKFNLSHSDSMALFGFTRGREIGIDVEKIRPDVPSGGLAELVFSSAELCALRSRPGHQQTDAFFANWTRKEAYVKAMGKGMSYPIKNLTILPGASRALIESENDREEASRWSIAKLDVGPGYAAALAVEGHDWTIRSWRLELA